MRFCIALLTLLSLLTTLDSAAQLTPANAGILCNEGDGSFQAESPNGVSLYVGATRKGKLAARTCDATLHWGKGTLEVAGGAVQLDLDAFGVDLGLGSPVASFQIKKSAAGCCMEFSVYSLDKPPHHLRTITGSDSFTTADTDLDGRLEIWAHDAEAVQAFERLGPGELQWLPTLVLRFSHGELLDVSADFQPYFDAQIADLRQQLDLQGALDFKKSDGKLDSTPTGSAEQIHALRAVKAKILEIVWAYLYSGRDEQAWKVLNEMWPSGDLVRIRANILDARARGISSQVNGISRKNAGARRKRIQVFDASSESGAGKQGFDPPVAILLRQPNITDGPEKHTLESESVLDLVIDSAGKVRSAQFAGKAQPMNASLLSAVNTWKFIPAFKSGKAVASSIRIAVSIKQ